MINDPKDQVVDWSKKSEDGQPVNCKAGFQNSKKISPLITSTLECRQRCIRLKKNGEARSLIGHENFSLKDSVKNKPHEN